METEEIIALRPSCKYLSLLVLICSGSEILISEISIACSSPQYSVVEWSSVSGSGEMKKQHLQK